MSENLVMTFPIKKRINTELFIDDIADPYVQNGKPNLLAILKGVKVAAKTNNGWE